MIEDELDLIERIIQKTKTFGICWTCSKDMNVGTMMKKKRNLHQAV